MSANNRRARFYTQTPDGRKRLSAETERDKEMAGAIACYRHSVTMVTAKWSRCLRFWFEHGRRARSLREEMESHLAMNVADLKEAGTPERDARGEAQRGTGRVPD